MEGLKQRLLTKIRNEFYCSLDELFEFAAELGHYQDLCKRELRYLASDVRLGKPVVPKIRPKTNDKGHIVGYHYIGNNINICQDQSSIVNTNQECTELTGVEFEKMAMKQYLEEQQKEQVTKPSQKRLMI